MKHVAIVSVAAAVLFAVPAAAQQRPAVRDTTHPAMPAHQMSAGGMGQMPGMQGGMAGGAMMHGDSAGGMMAAMMADMMGAMATVPEHLLARNDALRLTADQQRQVAALGDAVRPVHDAAMRNAQHHASEMADVLKTAAPDTAAVRIHFQAAFAAMGQAHLAMLTASARARALLTDAQRRQVDSLSGATGGGAMMMQHDHMN